MHFGDFQSICLRTALPLCSVVSSETRLDEYFVTGTLPECYARAVELSNTMIYEVGNAFIHIAGIFVCFIILFNVKRKYTAIARSEMLIFFYLFAALTIASLLVDCGVSPPGTSSYAYFVAVQIGLVGSCCWALMVNGFIYFQIWEDGTTKSLLFLRLTSFLIFALDFIVAFITFKSWSNATVIKTHTTMLFIVMYIINSAFLFIFVISQVILVVTSLNNLWALGAVLLGCFFFIVGQIILYVGSEPICNSSKHYIDGLFFATLFNVFSIMMVYKYWDMITTEDLEFSVAIQETGIAWNGTNNNNIKKQMKESVLTRSELEFKNNGEMKNLLEIS
ncbi:hypothetical protein PACTADRAFT_48727 [Pachysolen tannophilus NRRL Y-2460]|uniref:Chitin synthase export chaperone n=1 Tax=Pachysolen tannophilus NRRL Y-2460 TaxID=669874 RepID=A0A1E4TZ33_PACTA|nr:hypothetical protein PACTADRAFT_48727 [Pachysolen tannophilus NRRL Y-2460]